MVQTYKIIAINISNYCFQDTVRKLIGATTSLQKASFEAFESDKKSHNNLH